MNSEGPGNPAPSAIIYPVYSRVHPAEQVFVPGIMTEAEREIRHAAQAGVALHSGSSQVWYSEP